jgi:hypothetical protein
MRTITAIATGCATRFRDHGDTALADYEILELLLFRLIPRRDTKPIAKALLERFGSLAGVFGASPALLQEVKGIGEAVAFDLKLISTVAHRTLKSELKGKQVLASWSSVIEYCHAAMAHETREQFRILFLDKRNALIADEVQQTRHRRSHAGLSARSGQARARTFRDRPDSRPQSSLRRSDTVAGRYRHDQDDHRHRQAARDHRSRPHHHRQGWPCQPQGPAPDLIGPDQSHFARRNMR